MKLYYLAILFLLLGCTESTSTKVSNSFVENDCFVDSSNPKNFFIIKHIFSENTMIAIDIEDKELAGIFWGNWAKTHTKLDCGAILTYIAYKKGLVK